MLHQFGPGNFGEWIEKECEALGISVRRVAIEAKVDRTTIYRWKASLTQPRLPTMRAVQAVLQDFWARHDDKGFLDGRKV